MQKRHAEFLVPRAWAPTSRGKDEAGGRREIMDGIENLALK
jgi:hypothetical protein